MNIHKKARTTPQIRALLVHRVLREHWPVKAAAMAVGVSARTVSGRRLHPLHLRRESA